MVAYPDFLTRLDLDADADERQVRRAYARELKRIDQERDLEGFQYLRACYERALEWVADTDAPVAHEADAPAAHEEAPPAAPPPAQAPFAAPPPPPLPPPPPPPARHRFEPAPVELKQAAPAPQAPPPLALGAAVFADFLATTVNLAALPGKAGNDVLRIAPWAEALRAALADERLLNLDARVAFEQRVVSLLASGWRPGHHLLLPAAVEVFGWGVDRRALQRLGHPGRTLDAALEQRAMFQAQSIKVRKEQRAALALLREPAMPGERTMRRHIRAVRALAAQFPELLAVVAPRAVFVEWLERCPPTRREEQQAAVVQDEKRPWWRSWRVAAFLLFLLLRGLMILNRPDHDSPHGLDPDMYRRLQAPSTAVAPTREPVTQARLDQIRQRVAYRPGRNARPGVQSVRLQVVLGPDGAVAGIDELESPQDPALADAVKRAIRASGRFPPETARTFRVTYSVMLEARPAKAPQGPGQLLSGMDLWKPAPAKPLQLPAPMPANLPDAELAPQADPGR